VNHTKPRPATDFFNSLQRNSADGALGQSVWSRYEQHRVRLVDDAQETPHVLYGDVGHHTFALLAGRVTKAKEGDAGEQRRHITGHP
jgi:hypothetical protein